MTDFLFILIILGFAVVIFLLLRQKPQKEEGSLLMLQQQLNNLSQVLDTKLSESTKSIQEHYIQSTKIISDVTEKLTRLDETNKQVIDFADQLNNLQDILQNPKQRGILGEYYLETVLKNVLPPNNYQMQYRFKNGETVDAVVFVKDKIIPIDAKFSLENYNRLLQEKDKEKREELEKQFKNDLKNRIDETAKYIRPGEKTMDFAFMFIPAEGVYYDLLVNQVGTIKSNTRDLIEYAFKEKHVIIVSATSFFAYLQTVLQGLRALQIEESAKEIRKYVEALQRHLLSYQEYLKKLGNNLDTVVNMYNRTHGEFRKINKDVLKITGKGQEIEPFQIDGPESGEEDTVDSF